MATTDESVAKASELLWRATLRNLSTSTPPASLRNLPSLTHLLDIRHDAQQSNTNLSCSILDIQDTLEFNHVTLLEHVHYTAVMILLSLTRVALLPRLEGWTVPAKPTRISFC